MLGLQQLGLPFGLRSSSIRQKQINSVVNENKKHIRSINCHEKRNN